MDILNQKHYVIGIDVGSYSVGLAAVELDENDMPIRLLNVMSEIHDSGVDPSSDKYATRKQQSGIARRTRRLYNQRRRRLQSLDQFIDNQGWIRKEFCEYEDPYYPWRVRAELATTPISSPKELGEKLSVALRHIARHRGWRNPYAKAESLIAVSEPSNAFVEIREKIESTIGQTFPADVTVGQMMSACCPSEHKLRGPKSLVCSRLFQADFAREIHTICKTQGISHELYKQIITTVFQAKSPKGASAHLVGKDPLPGQGGKNRALKATDAFQKYRIASIIGNLRIREAGATRPLSQAERIRVYNHLLSVRDKEKASWEQVANLLDIDRGNLRGTATMTDDGERASAKPPVHETECLMQKVSLKPLKALWKDADDDVKAAIIRAISNSESPELSSPADQLVEDFRISLSDDDLAKLESVRLPIGRATYSEDSLQRLTKAMLDEGLDLYSARQSVFNVPNDWAPPKPQIDEPVGNPTVDRVLKIVARWLKAATREWGAPKSINIEHVRDGFISKKKKNSSALDAEYQKRNKRNENLFAQMCAELGIEGNIRKSDLWRYQSVQRQNGQCAYCGCPITYQTSEMDHIVPRAGVGSTNTRANLLAVCHQCNLSKGNDLFRKWAEENKRPGVSLEEALKRIDFWLADSGLSGKQFENFKEEVKKRLQRTVEDEPIDNRSIESVAWMANELRARIYHQYNSGDTADGIEKDAEKCKVRVFTGEYTAEARHASGIHNKLIMIGGTGKTRLDRRHHAIDAAVISLMSSYVAETLAERMSIRSAERYKNVPYTYKDYTGSDVAHQKKWAKWMTQMQSLCDLLQTAIDLDEIPITRRLRLRLGNSQGHEAKIHKLSKKKVGDELPVQLIDRAASEALWCALTRHPDFDRKNGLPADPNRSIRVHGRTLQADDTIAFFPVKAGCIAVRDGYVRIGSAFHHARIYRVPAGKKTAYAMLRVYTIDLLRFKGKDLFSVEIPPQTMSVRQAKPKLRQALADGTAEYLGWLVIDDEIIIDTSNVTTPNIADTREVVGIIERWNVDGFYGPSTLRLRPRQLSGEVFGKNKKYPKEYDVLKEIVDTEKQGWRPAVNVCFSTPGVRVVRRNALGQERLVSGAHLPTSWGVD